jgi:hypothetical protein
LPLRYSQTECITDGYSATGGEYGRAKWAAGAEPVDDTPKGSADEAMLSDYLSITNILLIAVVVGGIVFGVRYAKKSQGYEKVLG